MKQRLVVMNGQRIVQTTPPGTESFEAASNNVIGKASGLKPGVYSLYSALPADKQQSYSGQLIHADKESVYQKTGVNIIKHNRVDFDKVPEIGSVLSIGYSAQGKAETAAAALVQGRGLKR
ncbi:MAG: conjugal transfer protein TraO [Pseudomonadaceae bacterium]|nr:conjugal transfer protein TraO [Pseudomonadaceae bacterium]